MLEAGKRIVFDNRGYFIYIKPLGSGGTGQTHLFEDETTKTLFAVKKYVPVEANDIDENYERFVQEVKILFSLSHKNIVRIYSYYLFPKRKTGYLQMEYVDGDHIGNFRPYCEKGWNDIFVDVVKAFRYLELNRVLHRDIRPENILVGIDGEVKVIDFGFGKKLSPEVPFGGSVLLNWPVSVPPREVVEEGVYNHQTEIYFLGKLFVNLGLDCGNDFRYKDILRKMTQYSPVDRYSSFSEIVDELSTSEFRDLEIAQYAKDIYQTFARSLVEAIDNFKAPLVMERRSEVILSALSSAIRGSCFEDYIQNNSVVIDCFVKQQYAYFGSDDVRMWVNDVRDFFNMFRDADEDIRQVLLDNIQNRLKTIKVLVDYFDNVPF